MNSNHVFILTGAGISAESGLGTFRDKDGLWTKYDLDDVASIRGYHRNPQRVLDFYNARRAGLADAKPNAAHHALARLGNSRKGQITLCTQNIDDMHEQAGSRDVLHMHGELNKTRCHDCGDVRPADGDLLVALGCLACGRVGGLRPHVVWFGEEPLEMDRIFEALSKAELFVAIGTSGAVYPAAGFVGAARSAGVATMEINLEPSDNAHMFDAARYGKASETVPAWVEEMLALP